MQVKSNLTLKAKLVVRDSLQAQADPTINNLLRELIVRSHVT
jgi:hypothetical protein